MAAGRPLVRTPDAERPTTPGSGSRSRVPNPRPDTRTRNQGSRVVNSAGHGRRLDSDVVAVLRIGEPDVLPPRRHALAHRPAPAQLHLPFATNIAPLVPSGAPTVAEEERRQMCAQLLLLAAQTALGLRPVTQAVRWTTRAVYEDLQRKHLRATAVHRSVGHQPGNFALLGVRAQQVSERVLECCATAVTGGRSGAVSYRAIALRVAEHEGGWWVTHIDM